MEAYIGILCQEFHVPWQFRIQQNILYREVLVKRQNRNGWDI